MVFNDKKQELLAFLRQQKEAMALPDLLHCLKKDYPERSVRRWLHEMLENNLVEKIGNRRGTRYRAVLSDDSLSAEKTERSANLFSEESQKSIRYIKQTLFKRAPVSYHKKWLDSYRPNETFYLSQEKRNALFAHGKKDVAHDPAGTFARKIYQRLLIDLSYNSSRLEGNTYSLIETEKLVLEGLSDDKKLDSEKIMILNHKEAIRHLVDRIQKINVSIDEIMTLHFLLADALISPEYAGKIRDHGVRISYSAYVPLENPEKLTLLLRAICEKAKKINDPFEQSFFLLAHISYLQAFTDVNKRTARLSANIPLIKNNLVPLSFNDMNKDDYTSAVLCIYELNDVKPLADLYCFSYLRTCQLYNVTMESIGFDEVRARYRNERRELLRNIITNKLTGQKLIDYLEKETAKKISLNDQAAFKKNVDEDLLQLSPQRIAGLGITRAELQAWLALLKK